MNATYVVTTSNRRTKSLLRKIASALNAENPDRCSTWAVEPSCRNSRWIEVTGPQELGIWGRDFTWAFLEVLEGYAAQQWGTLPEGYPMDAGARARLGLSKEETL